MHACILQQLEIIERVACTRYLPYAGGIYIACADTQARHRVHPGQSLLGPWTQHRSAGGWKQKKQKKNRPISNRFFTSSTEYIGTESYLPPIHTY